MNAVPGARTQTTLPLSPPQSNMAPPSEDNGKVKKDITRLPWRCAHHIRVIYTCKWYVIMFGLWLFKCFTPPLSQEHWSNMICAINVIVIINNKSTYIAPDQSRLLSGALHSY